MKGAFDMDIDKLCEILVDFEFEGNEKIGFLVKGENGLGYFVDKVESVVFDVDENLLIFIPYTL